MAFNGSGIFNRLYSWVTDANNDIKIRSDRMDAEFDGIATALSKCILKDGQQTITNNMPWNGKRITDLGDASADTDALNRQSGDGRYLQLENNLSDVLDSTATRDNLGLGNLAVLNQTSTQHIVDAAVTTGKINDLAVTLEKHAPATAGDLLYYNNAGNLVVLPKGSDNEVLTLASGLPSWIPLPSGVETGTSVMWNSPIAPSGYLEENGAAVSRATYSDLFAVIGTMYGAGDGSTTFNIPDSRGYAVRGWNHGAGNDPDASSRLNRGDGTTGDFVGTVQNDAYRSHRHVGGTAAATLSSATHYGNINTGHSAYGGASDVGTYGAYTSSVGGNETRMKNINKMFIIKT